MLGIICGLQNEARIAQKITGARVGCSGARPKKARALADALVRAGCTRLMSFGIAGGLEPGLGCGTIVIGDQVVTKEHSYPCSTEESIALKRYIPEARVASVFGSEVLLITEAEKLAHNRDFGCALVDMESQCAAEVAHHHRIPFTVVRVVCDGAEVSLPPELMTTITEDGFVDYLATLTVLMKKPRLLKSFLHLGRSTARALSRLQETVQPIDLFLHALQN